MSLNKIKNYVHKYFWFNKESRNGTWYIVSGLVIHPAWKTNPETQGENLDHLKDVTRSIVRIEGIN